MQQYLTYNLLFSTTNIDFQRLINPKWTCYGPDYKGKKGYFCKNVLICHEIQNYSTSPMGCCYRLQ